MVFDHASRAKFNHIDVATFAQSIQNWLIKRIAPENADSKHIDLNTNFSQYGVESAALLSITAELAAAHGVALPHTIAFDYPTVASLAQYVTRLKCPVTPPDISDSENVVVNAASPVNPVIRLEAPDDAIAVIGLGCRFPGGSDSPEAFWQLLRTHGDAITPIPEDRWDSSAYYAPHPGGPGRMYIKEGGFIEDIYGFDADYFGISPREAKNIDPQQRLVLEVAMQALESAGVTSESLVGSQSGVFIGVSGSDYGRMAFRDINHLSLYAGTGSASSVAANRLSYYLGLRGPSLAVDTACSSSLVAVHLACQSLRNGESELAIAGGVNAILSPEMHIMFCNANLMAPDARCKTFDAKANGYVRSEGCGIVVLKSLKKAIVDKDNIWGVIYGSSVNQDGFSNGLTVPNGNAQQELLRTALKNAGLAPSQVDYLETHGTGTPVGDPIEFEAIKSVYGDTNSKRPNKKRTNPLLLGSVKSNIGHLEQAAGVAGLIKVLLSIKHGELPGNLHFSTPNPLIDLESVPAIVPVGLQPLPKERSFIAGVSGFSFGGTNAHVIVGSYNDNDNKIHHRRSASEHQPSSIGAADRHLVFFSARTSGALNKNLEIFQDYLENNGNLVHSRSFMKNVSYTSMSCRTHHKHRIAIKSMTSQELTAAIATIRQSECQDGRMSSLDPSIRHGIVPSIPPNVGFAFTGQGAQHFGMGRKLYQTQIIFKTAMDDCARAFAPFLPEPLLSVMFHDSFNNGRIDQTGFAQPAIFALEYALAKLWMSWGLKPSVLVGHSIGEYVCACLADIFSLEDAAKLVANRGLLMQALPKNGGMLAVFASSADVLALVNGREGVVIAASNSDKNTVLSGLEPVLQDIATQLQAQGVYAVPLAVSHAFHSPLMEPMLNSFLDVARTVSYSAPLIPIISTLTGAPVSTLASSLAKILMAPTAGPIDKNMADPEYWAEHIVRPVLFQKASAALELTDTQVMLEMGPAPVLCNIVKSSSSAGNIDWVSTLNRSQDERESVLDSLGALFIKGVGLDWKHVSMNAGVGRIHLPGYSFEHTSYRLDPIPDIPAPSSTTGGSGIIAPKVAPGATVCSNKFAVNSSLDFTAEQGLPGQTVDPQADPEEIIKNKLCTIFQMQSADLLPVDVPLLRLGLDSLMGMSLKNFILEHFFVDLPLSEILAAPSIRSLASQMSKGKTELVREEFPTIVHDVEKRFEAFPLTEVQRAYWMGRQPGLSLGGVSCHVYVEIDAKNVDIPRFEEAVNRLIARHDMLRTVINEDGLQRLLPEVPRFYLEVDDFSDDSSDADHIGRLDLLNRKREQLSRTPLPSDVWPLFSLKASRLDKETLRLHIVFDMLIGDGHSFTILSEELKLLYLDTDTSLPELFITFRDYVVATEGLKDGERYRKSREYWEQRFDSMPRSPELPLAANPEQLDKPVFSRKHGRLNPEQWNAVKQVASQRGITPSALLLAAFCRVLGVWSASKRFCLNLTLFNRLPLHDQINSVVGDFTTLLLLEADCASDASFIEFSRTLQDQLWSDLEHRHVSAIEIFHLLRKKGGSEVSLMPVVFTSLLPLSGNDNSAGFMPDGLGVEVTYCLSQTPQVYFDHQVYEEKGELRFNWDVVEALFPEGLLDDMLDAYLVLLRGLADSEQSWEKSFVAEDILNSAYIKKIEVLNNVSATFEHKTLHELFEDTVHRAPAATALRTTAKTLTYQELETHSNAIAAQLTKSGLVPGGIVGVVMEKGWEQIPAVLGILKAGGAYLPLNARQPIERINQLLNRTKAGFVLTQPEFQASLDWPANITVFVVESYSGKPVKAPSKRLSRDDLAYVIFTSGSTGLPKGVQQDHGSVVNTVLDINQRFALGSSDVVLGVSNLDFDLSVFDIFGTFAAGGTLVLPEAETRREPAHWLKLLKDFGITVWNSTPALLQMLTTFLDDQPMPENSLRLAMLSGDWIPVTLPSTLLQLFPGLRVISLGGATEAAIWSISYDTAQMSSGMPSVPYGIPLTNQKLMVLDQSYSICPAWAVGELYIGGVGLALGYWDDQERTNQQFVHSSKTGERLYRTGDLGRYLPDGNIEFIGRKDFQVKIRGHRIEIGEIEHVLKQHSSVVDAVVLAIGKPGENRRLCAYVQTNTASGIWSPNELPVNFGGKLAEYLRGKLPEYMVPSSIIIVESFPLTENGKVDRKALMEQKMESELTDHPDSQPSTNGQFATETEKSLLALWSEVLGDSSVSINDNFFEIGGDSLLAARIVAQVRKRFGVEISLNIIFSRPSIQSLAEHIDNSEVPAVSLEEQYPQIIPDQSRRFEPFPLTSIQHAYWMGRNAAFELGNVSAHFFYEIDTENLDLKRLNEAWNTVVKRHDMLRATVLPDGTQQVAECVAPYIFKVYDLTTEQNSEIIDKHLEDIRQEMSTQMLRIK